MSFCTSDRRKYAIPRSSSRYETARGRSVTAVRSEPGAHWENAPIPGVVVDVVLHLGPAKVRDSEEFIQVRDRAGEVRHGRPVGDFPLCDGFVDLALVGVKLAQGFERRQHVERLSVPVLRRGRWAEIAFSPVLGGRTRPLAHLASPA